MEDDLIFAVAIEVAGGGIVRQVALRGPEGQRQVGARRGVSLQGEGRAGRSLLPCENRSDEVGVGLVELRLAVEEARRAAEGLPVELHRRAAARGAVEVEGEPLRVGAEETPPHEHLAVLPDDRHHPPAEAFHLPIGAGQAQRKRQGQDRRGDAASPGEQGGASRNAHDGAGPSTTVGTPSPRVPGLSGVSTPSTARTSRSRRSMSMPQHSDPSVPGKGWRPSDG